VNFLEILKKNWAINLVILILITGPIFLLKCIGEGNTEWYSIWINILLVFVTFQYVILTTGILINQDKSSKENIRLALFERRYKIYNFFGSLLDEMILFGLEMENKFPNIDRNDFHNYLNETLFLFNDDIKSLSSEIYSSYFEFRSKANNFFELNHNTNNNRKYFIIKSVKDPAYDKNADKEFRNQTKEFFLKMADRIRNDFEKYLNFKNITKL
jgi:hypothetical protein